MGPRYGVLFVNCEVWGVCSVVCGCSAACVVRCAVCSEVCVMRCAVGIVGCVLWSIGCV